MVECEQTQNVTGNLLSGRKAGLFERTLNCHVVFFADHNVIAAQDPQKK